jgi:hypothetical protein
MHQLIVIVTARHAGYQLNSATGMRRPVRRIGDDDASLFFVVDRAAVESEDKCAVCQEEFTDKDGKAREAVRIECHCDHQVPRSLRLSLPPRASHTLAQYFHRTCIAAWLKVYHTCPCCRHGVGSQVAGKAEKAKARPGREREERPRRGAADAPARGAPSAPAAKPASDDE